jgi:hypothetical protein
LASGVAAGQAGALPPSPPLAGDDEELHPIATAASKPSAAAKRNPVISCLLELAAATMVPAAR